MFRAFADEGHYKGRGGTRQGIYAVTPAGALLASCNSNDPSRVSRMMKQALEAWASHPPRERFMREDPGGLTVARRNAKYPEGGLVLQVISRDLPREKKLGGWRDAAWNYDYAWFTADEARQLLAARVARGAAHEVPQALVARLARFHLLDNVRGQTIPYGPDGVEVAKLATRITRVRRGVAELELKGSSRTEDGARGVDVQLLGTAAYDLRRKRFVRFELLAIGTRWGASRYNFRQNDTDRAPIGFLLRLAGDSPQEKVLPEHFHAYGWP